MMDTIQYNLGIYIDTYVLFDFEAFTAVIDALGGIEVDVPNFIHDPTFPDMDFGYDPFTMTPGKHVFDGRTALKYARTRHSDNDYLRGQRQLQVVTAVRERLMTPGVLPGLIPQVPALMDELRSNVYTDITPDEMLRLAQAALNVPSEYIFTGAIDDKMSLPVGTPAGTVRVPDREKLAELMLFVFGDYA
jgi:anionic cell wall polymer biosynthesis LytR-Cps2A-Psr (LCP) family protein